MAKHILFILMSGLIASASACSDDESGGATTTPGATSSTTSTGTGGAGGGGGSGTATGGAGGAATCSHCDAAGKDPLGAFSGMLCSASQQIYDALVACACGACMTECADS